ncbi:TetR/AcrR family transcriptional regulator [Microlunatus parietis]|uniref:AcrR family transcriptional regulator n=1 Tax=Microlunatus parietis TaxID=682979 RepID=A0A7Y9I3C7_9ACTN|nr:TetR/AcrR family transcriptional regulator [Microlunatus parietis]NYE69457.1 AcrR family transcriptional regulator [Microlunatus parietis]
MPSQRRRPATRKGRPVLTRAAIAEKALELAGVQGFRAVTMRALAGELGVTVRALYNYVDDRQQVIDLAVGLMIEAWEPPTLDPEAWEQSIADYAGSLRRLYRRWPRALLISIEEDAPPTAVHPNRLINLERLLRLLCDVGLSLPAALEVHRHLALQLLSFALLVDYPADQAGTAGGSPLVPQAWLEARADLDLPTLREAAALPAPTPDEQFESLIATVTAQIRGRLTE